MITYCDLGFLLSLSLCTFVSGRPGPWWLFSLTCACREEGGKADSAPPWVLRLLLRKKGKLDGLFSFFLSFSSLTDIFSFSKSFSLWALKRNKNLFQKCKCSGQKLEGCFQSSPNNCFLLHGLSQYKGVKPGGAEGEVSGCCDNHSDTGASRSPFWGLPNGVCALDGFPQSEVCSNRSWTLLGCLVGCCLCSECCESWQHCNVEGSSSPASPQPDTGLGSQQELLVMPQRGNESKAELRLTLFASSAFNVPHSNPMVSLWLSEVSWPPLCLFFLCLS